MDTFGAVLIAVSVIAVIVAALSYWGSGAIYSGLGRGDFEHDDPKPGGGGATPAEANEEIRQMLEAQSRRREARGEAALDIEAEIAALTRPAGADAALRDEVRQLVIARNERRERRGEEPLEVEAEVDRQLRELGA